MVTSKPYMMSFVGKVLDIAWDIGVILIIGLLLLATFYVGSRHKIQ